MWAPALQLTTRGTGHRGTTTASIWGVLPNAVRAAEGWQLLVGCRGQKARGRSGTVTIG